MPRNAVAGAELLAAAYAQYRTRFAALTRRAAARFARADWAGGQRDAVERLELYGEILDPAVKGLAELLGGDLASREAWGTLRAEYARAVEAFPDAPLAETFFNSASRHVLATKGVDPLVEIRRAGSDPPRPPSPRDVARYERKGSAGEELLSRALAGSCLPWRDLRRDASRAARALAADLVRAFGSADFDAMELVRSPFFRGKGAYLVGRVTRGRRIVPLVVAVVHDGAGAVVDAVLTEEDETSIVFSFTRAYFHVDAEDPVGLVGFLKTIMPKKPVAELYIALGLNKHGKSELWRDLAHHLATSSDLFVEAPGESGMVMAVFTLPSFDVVFKVIRDVFAAPKTSSREEVREKYRLVFRHGRAGRLVDTQEFTDLELPRARFAAETLARLLALAPSSVRLDGERVLIKHLYTERRLVPLNLYLAHADEAAACAAIVDYGQALRELAATNVFPGDLLLKNFGVTRHRRVVFYDYDELALLLDCNFRELPRAATPDEETSAEPWFYVGENDVFPEELLPFLGLKRPLQEAFLEAHGELLTARFWTSTQEKIRAGEILDVFPYPQARRLNAAGPAPR
ncbi:MAG TPA: bifunctional isocitrate dehydrogenase kinase/phosphatase [Thermoanaerobaculia bacterium]|nr:bifunctional isocitrate dehydrogenase kinase/phosphatase [Thermoanaerobaculia bacterium]